MAGAVEKRVSSNSWRMKLYDGGSVMVTTRKLRVLEVPENVLGPENPPVNDQDNVQPGAFI